MRILKIILSVVALLIAAIGIAHTTGVIPISNESATMLLSLSGLLGIFGVSPIKLSLNTARALSGISAFIVAAGPVQAAGHLWIPSFAWHIIAIVGTLMGVAGTSALQGGAAMLRRMSGMPPKQPPSDVPPTS